MKKCELCKYPARMYCESDQASLCWDCDAKVHGANFLVARHLRSLLCHACQSPTPWKASGEKLGPTVSVCERCVGSNGGRTGGDGEEESEGGNDDEIDSEDDLDESDDDDDEEEEEEEEEEEVRVDDEDGDNQVVPWSSTPPPPAASSSSSDDSSSRISGATRDVSESSTVFSLKRMRGTAADLRSHDDLGCASSQRNYGSAMAAMAARTRGEGEATSGVDSLRPLKNRRTESNQPVRVQYGSRSAAIITPLKKFRHQDIGSGGDATAATIGVCDQSEETKAVDLDGSANPSRPI
ncbi:hypothetical protein L1049_024312 [Liquidambar formosana]|uniref:B box-type domain-containing protein n=1 Tax=Liquidambar formosana TaxID=63359 RepID=A0AAP0WZH7_LIQFO